MKQLTPSEYGVPIICESQLFLIASKVGLPGWPAPFPRQYTFGMVLEDLKFITPAITQYPELPPTGQYVKDFYVEGRNLLFDHVSPGPAFLTNRLDWDGLVPSHFLEHECDHPGTPRPAPHPTNCRPRSSHHISRATPTSRVQG
jgi:hypothetical protein